MQYLRQNTATTLKIGPFLDEVTMTDPEAGLTIAQADVRLSKNGGDIAQKNSTDPATHDELGYYDCAINETDNNIPGPLLLAVHTAGALPVKHEYMVMPTNVYDSLFGAEKLQVDAVEISGDLAAADALELWVENAKGTDHKVLLSNDAQVLANMGIATVGTVDIVQTLNALATLPVATIAGAIWDEVIEGAHTAASSAGEYLLISRQKAVGKADWDASNNERVFAPDDTTVLVTLGYVGTAPTITRTPS